MKIQFSFSNRSIRTRDNYEAASSSHAEHPPKQKKAEGQHYVVLSAISYYGFSNAGYCFQQALKTSHPTPAVQLHLSIRQGLSEPPRRRAGHAPLARTAESARGGTVNSRQTGYEAPRPRRLLLQTTTAPSLLKQISSKAAEGSMKDKEDRRAAIPTN